MSTTSTDGATEQPVEKMVHAPAALEAVARAIKELQFGVVEVVVHQGKVREIRQTRRTRFEE